MSQQINLFNPIFLAQKRHFSTVAMLKALALMLAGLVLVDILAVRQSSMLESLLADSARDVEQYRERLVGLSREFSRQGTSKTLEDDIVRSEERLRRRRELVNEMTTNVGGNTDGFSGYLSALARQSVQGVWLVGIEIDGKSNDLVIRGRALNSELVPAYVRSLSREPAFTGRALSSLQITAVTEAAGTNPLPAGRTPQRYLEFTLSIPLGAASATSKAAS